VTGGFRPLEERLVHQGHLIRVVVGTFEAPGGTRFERDLIRHPGVAAVVAVDGDEVVLVRQYRAAVDDYLLEIPAGTMDKEGEAPEVTAERELGEEIGARAARFEHLSTYWVAPGISDERMHVFLATGLTFGATSAHGPEEQHMTVERVPLAATANLIAEGRILDAKSIIGLLLAARRLAARRLEHEGEHDGKHDR
jgi:ADP-ribose pyrophosphatase